MKAHLEELENLVIGQDVQVSARFVIEKLPKTNSNFRVAGFLQKAEQTS